MSDESQDSSSTAGATATSFATTWDDDGGAFLPQNIPLKRIARAWDRKPHSPFAQKQGARKVWRRVRMPVYQPAVRDEPDLEAKVEFDAPEQHVSIQSPKKAVKKQCLKTSFGQNWRTTAWEAGRAPHARKQAARAPIVLRSGAMIDPNIGLDEAEAMKSLAVARKPAMVNDVDDRINNDSDSDWEDVESENGLDDDNESVTNHPENTTARAKVEEQDRVGGGEEQQGDDADLSRVEAVEDSAASLGEESPVTHEQERGSSEADKPLQGLVGVTPEPETSSAATAAPEDSLVTEETATGDDEAFEGSGKDDKSAEQPIVQVESAPESRHKPRISADDTAFLTAFLSRQAANKKPSMAKRESLTNRRDSGTVRQALASPARPEVLAELDANSPLPQKVNRDENKDQAPESPRRGKSPIKAPVEQRDDEARPTRRSGRSRARPDLLVNQTSDQAALKQPSKITIRGPTEQISLKKSDVQELAAQTRANTRKNKGQSVMPPTRLSKLAAENHASQETSATEIADSQASSTEHRKRVRWDETLAYFSKAPEEPSVKVEKALQPPDMSTGLPIEEPPMSPTKARSKRARKATSPKKSVAVEDGIEPVDAAHVAPKTAAAEALAPTKTAPVPTKRRSRIATPAKGLLSRAALLPDGLSSEATAGSEAGGKLPAPAKKHPSLPTPSGLQSQPATSSPRKLSASSTSTSTSGIPSLTTFAPRLNLSTSDPAGTQQQKSLSLEEALGAAPSMSTRLRTVRSGGDAGVGASGGNGALPGLRSPAKKRRRGGAGDGVGDAGRARGLRAAGEEALLPGLASPAKKRGRV